MGELVSNRTVNNDKFEEKNAILLEYGRQILESDNFKQTMAHMQHGSMSVYHHSLNVARYSIAINRYFKLGAIEKELIRGALLHDYFLYDWHTQHHCKLHGFYHPGIALRNAEKEYHLSKREKDIIRKHMWPLTIVPPLCREAWIVTMADKYCSLLETIRIHNRKFAQGVTMNG